MLDLPHAIKLFYMVYTKWIEAPARSAEEKKWADCKIPVWNMVQSALKRAGVKNAFNRSYTITRHIAYLVEKKHWSDYGLHELNVSISRK